MKIVLCGGGEKILRVIILFKKVSNKIIAQIEIN